MTTSTEAKPFLKWIGGKTQLLNELLARMPERYERYYEPFVGGGALFFRVQAANRMAGMKVDYFLSDANGALVNCYVCVRDDVEGVIEQVQRFVRFSKGSEEEQYYHIRKELPGYPTTTTAAAFIYLNKNGFNGLCRYNKAGGFNTPWGKYAPAREPDYDNLRRCSAALQGVTIAQLDALSVLPALERGHFAYADPPYVPVSPTASFTSYTAGGFGANAQQALANGLALAAGRGAHVVASNADVPLVREYYGAYSDLLAVDAVTATRRVNCKAAKRGAVGEVIIYNRRAL